MATYKSIAYDQVLVNPSVMVLLNEQTASTSANLTFSSGIDSTYKEYVFKFINIHPATDSTEFSFQVDTGTNTNYNQTITSTYFAGYQNELGTGSGITYPTQYDQAQGTGFQPLADKINNDNDSSVSGELHIFNPSTTTFVKHFIGRCQGCGNDDYAIDIYTAGYVNTTTALTRAQFKMSSGNIDAGTIKMYGIN
tara:strand:+ start:29 stop:613 length:585 start_codon:yes stop_codon:yes gene_type:complete